VQLTPEAGVCGVLRAHWFLVHDSVGADLYAGPIHLAALPSCPSRPRMSAPRPFHRKQAAPEVTTATDCARRIARDTSLLVELRRQLRRALDYF